MYPEDFNTTFARAVARFGAALLIPFVTFVVTLADEKVGTCLAERARARSRSARAHRRSGVRFEKSSRIVVNAWRSLYSVR